MIFQTVSRALIPGDSLNIAIKENHVTLARLLLENGHRLDGTDRDGYTPLCYALVCHRQGSDEDGADAMLDLLLSRGADVNQECEGVSLSHGSWKTYILDPICPYLPDNGPQIEPSRPCEFCCREQFPSATKQASRGSIPVRPIHLAARMKCRASPLRKLIKAGAKVDEACLVHQEVVGFELENCRRSYGASLSYPARAVTCAPGCWRRSKHGILLERVPVALGTLLYASYEGRASPRVNAGRQEASTR